MKRTTQGDGSPSREGLPRRRRRVLMAAAIGAALPLLVLAVATTRGNGPSTESVAGSGATGDSSVGQAEGLDGVSSPSTASSGGEAQKGGAQGRDPRDLILVGSLHAKRLVALPLDALREAARRNDRNQIPVAVLSEVVGSPFVVQPMGDSLVIATTNVRTLIKVPKLLVGKPVELSVADAIRSGESLLEFGALVPLDDDRLLVSVGFSTKVAVVEIRVSTFKVLRAQVFDDRFGASPRMCKAGGSNRVFLTSSKAVDILDVSSLHRVATVSGVAAPSGLACVNDVAWVSEFSKSTGSIVDSDGRPTGTFGWAGQDSQYLHFSPEANLVFGSDPARGIVFACAVSGGTCKASEQIGRKPTDLLFSNGSLFVTLESAQQIAVLSPDLRLEGAAAFPDLPRTLTLVTASR